MEETIPYVTYAFFSFEEDGEETRDYLKAIVEKGPKIAIGTFGEEGSLAWDGENFYTYGICKANLVNTIGLGILILRFHDGILKGYSIKNSMAQGAKVSAEVVSTFGPWPGKRGKIMKRL